MDKTSGKNTDNLAKRQSAADEERLRKLDFRQLVDLFSQLPPPLVADMNGEYAGELLAQRGLIDALPVKFLLYTPVLLGKWQGKAFRPISEERGRGYNTFFYFGHAVRIGPMETLIAPSRFDGRPAYQLVYAAYRWSIGEIVHMVDEVRQVSPSVFLGMGTWGFTDRHRHRPIPFLLSGPLSAYQTDVGMPIDGFDFRKVIPALRKVRTTATSDKNE